MVSEKYRDPFIESLIKEVELQKGYLEGEKINSIYFGGGTPSLLKINQLQAIVDKIYSVFKVDPEVEITMEANPDDIDADHLKQWSEMGINRLSMGVQSFKDEDLLYLNRVHDSRQAKNAIRLAQDSGFENITIDLIYGIPTLSDENWIRNISDFLSFQLPHLSAYALTVEPRTALDILIRKGKMKIVDEPSGVKHFTILMKEMQNADYMHYEISNFGREGLFSNHNMGYWNGELYLGLGPSAHSYNQKQRQWNVSNISKYIKSLNQGIIPADTELLTTTERFNEYIMTSLRTMWGVDIDYLNQHFDPFYIEHFLNEVSPSLKNGRLIQSKGNYTLSNDGKLFADGIASMLFV